MPPARMDPTPTPANTPVADAHSIIHHLTKVKGGVLGIPFKHLSFFIMLQPHVVKQETSIPILPLQTELATKQY